MKLTDKEIIEALMSGKRIRIDSCPSREAKLVNGCLEYCDNGRTVSVGIDLLARNDFEIVETEIDWDKVIKEGYLCKFWDGDAEPDSLYRYSIDELDVYANNNGTNESFKSYSDIWWEHCRPLRVNEVKLITDEKELWK